MCYTPRLIKEVIKNHLSLPLITSPVCHPSTLIDEQNEKSNLYNFTYPKEMKL